MKIAALHVLLIVSSAYGLHSATAGHDTAAISFCLMIFALSLLVLLLRFERRDRGWICPRCDGIHAPDVRTCDCHAVRVVTPEPLMADYMPYSIQWDAGIELRRRCNRWR